MYGSGHAFLLKIRLCQVLALQLFNPHQFSPSGIIGEAGAAVGIAATRAPYTCHAVPNRTCTMTTAKYYNFVFY